MSSRPRISEVLVGNPVDGGDELFPGVFLGGQNARARVRQAVVTTPALTGLFDPAALNPAALFESIKERVKGGDAKDNRAAGTRFDELAQLVTVPRLRFEQRQNQQLGAALLELAIEQGADIFHSNILLESI